MLTAITQPIMSDGHRQPVFQIRITTEPTVGDTDQLGVKPSKESRARSTGLYRSPESPADATFGDTLPVFNTSEEDGLYRIDDDEVDKRAKTRSLVPLYTLYRIRARASRFVGRRLWRLVLGFVLLISAYTLLVWRKTEGEAGLDRMGVGSFVDIEETSLQTIPSSDSDSTLSTPPIAIETLIRTATQRWDRKVAAQSTTLKQATAEYQRRYGRLPPKGFEQWWYYCL
jgi:hypothetical protein